MMLLGPPQPQSGGGEPYLQVYHRFKQPIFALLSTYYPENAMIYLMFQAYIYLA